MSDKIDKWAHYRGQLWGKGKQAADEVDRSRFEMLDDGSGTLRVKSGRMVTPALAAEVYFWRRSQDSESAMTDEFVRKYMEGDDDLSSAVLELLSDFVSAQREHVESTRFEREKKRVEEIAEVLEAPEGNK